MRTPVFQALSPVRTLSLEMVHVMEGLNACLAIGLVGFAAAVVRAASSIDSWVFLFLAGKPVIDLGWRWQFFRTAEQSVNLQALVAVLVVLFTLVALRVRSERIVKSRLVTGLLLLAFLSVVVTPTSWGVNELIRLCAGISFFFTAGFVLCDERRFDLLANWFLLALTIPLLLSFLQLADLLPYEYWDWIPEKGGTIGRVSGTYNHPLGLIYFLVYSTPLALYLLDKHPGRRVYRLRLSAFLGLSLTALVFTYHRAAVAALVLQVALWFLLSRKYTMRHLLFGVAVVAILAAIFAGWLQILYQPLSGLLQGGLEESGWDFLRGRGLNWYVFLASFLGGGPLVWLIGRGGSIAEGIVPGIGFWASNEPHNDFIRILHAYGVIGLGLYLAIVLRLFVKARRLRLQPDSFSRSLGTIVLTVLPSLFLLSLTTEPMRYPSAVWYLFAFASVTELRCRQVT